MKSRRPNRLPRSTPPDSAEREYFRFLNRYASEYIRLLRHGLDTILPGLRVVAAREIPDGRKISRSDAFRMDENIEAKIKKLLDGIGEQLNLAFDEAIIRRAVVGMIRHVSKGSKKNAQKQFKAGFRPTGFNITGEIPDFEPMMHDKDLNPYFENIIEQNVGLVKSISEYRKTTFKNAIVEAITKDSTQGELTQIIETQFGTTRNKARLLARDQVGKLNGALNKYRQEQLGVKRYIWRSSADSRERQSHRDLNNTTQRWNKPPVVGSGKKGKRRCHPGEDFQCRCWAEMVLDDILD